MGRPRCSDSCEGGHEVGSFSDGVHHYHHCIVACRIREFDDEIHADRVPGVVRNWQGMEPSHRRVPVGLRLEALIAGGNILPDVPRHLGPPIIPGHQFQGFPPAGVSRLLCVMAEGYNVSLKVRCVRDIDLPSEVEDPINDHPFSCTDGSGLSGLQLFYYLCDSFLVISFSGALTNIL